MNRAPYDVFSIILPSLAIDIDSTNKHILRKNGEYQWQREVLVQGDQINREHRVVEAGPVALVVPEDQAHQLDIRVRRAVAAAPELREAAQEPAVAARPELRAEPKAAVAPEQQQQGPERVPREKEPVERAQREPAVQRREHALAEQPGHGQPDNCRNRKNAGSPAGQVVVPALHLEQDAIAGGLSRIKTERVTKMN